MLKAKLLSTASFRLTALYLALFTFSAIAVDSFVYIYIQHSQAEAFADRIEEETGALVHLFNVQGRARLVANIDARTVSGGSLVYGLYDPNGSRISGRTPLVLARRVGWEEAPELIDPEGKEEATPDVVRMLTTQLRDNSFLVIGDERTAVDKMMSQITQAFVWALVVALGLGLVGGLWLSRHFLKRLELMNATAHAIMSGDWRRRIPESAIEDDLTALARTFNRLFDRIEKLLIAQRQVGADIAHDLRRPLMKVMRELQRAREGGGDEAIARSIAGVEEVRDTFEALLRISEVESGARRAAFSTLDFAELVRDVVEAFRPSAEEEGRSLTSKLEGPLPMRGDAALLKQAVANLMDNALRHTDPGVAIEIKAVRMGDDVVLQVGDHGVGVLDADRTKLFDRFYRTDAARRSPGSGLGLALVAAIADLHGMEIGADDNHPGLQITLRSSIAAFTVED